MSPRERADLFNEAAERKGVSEAIIKKDFWVCWMIRGGGLVGLTFQKGISEHQFFRAMPPLRSDFRSFCGLGFSTNGLSKRRRDG
jgi:hypothetical protein